MTRFCEAFDVAIFYYRKLTIQHEIVVRFQSMDCSNFNNVLPRSYSTFEVCSLNMLNMLNM